MANINISQKETDKEITPKRTPKPLVAITVGDPNGIGYEVMLKALADPHISEICCPIIYGNTQHAQQWLEKLDSEYSQLRLTLINAVEEIKESNKVYIINAYTNAFALTPGTSTQEAGEASRLALERATTDIKNRKVSVLITAPINKENIQSEAFNYSGHTEYLTSLFGKGKDSLMMMVSDVMKVALVCNHVPLSKVPQYITEEQILTKLEVLNQTLQNDFTIRRPRIAVLALNPHASDNGLLGTEEQEVIIPTIKKANEQGILAFGPYSADGFFGAGRYVQFDAVLAMYHDQGLIPIKSLDMNGVNFTAGLDIIRTSPDHGTAYELAGKNTADHTSFLHALYMSIDVWNTRRMNRIIAANPLKNTNE